MYELIFIIDKMLRRLQYREGKRTECEPDCAYSDWLIIKIWLICVLENWTVNVLYAKLARAKTALRRRYHLPTRLPSRSTVYHRLRQRSLWYRLREFFHESTRSDRLLYLLFIMGLLTKPLPSYRQKDPK